MESLGCLCALAVCLLAQIAVVALWPSPTGRKAFISIPHAHGGFGNGIANLVNSIVFTEMHPQCIYLANLEIFTKYYDFPGVEFCRRDFGLEHAQVAQVLGRALLFRGDEFCDARMNEYDRHYLFYSAHSFYLCDLQSDPRVGRYLNASALAAARIVGEERMNAILRFVFLERMRLSAEWLAVLRRRYPFTEHEFFGAHIRTYGVFHDFKDLRGVSDTYQTESILVSLERLWRRRRLFLAFCSDSVRMKVMVRDRLGVNASNGYISYEEFFHSHSSKHGLDDDTVLEMEMLAYSSEMLLTHLSSYSLVIYFKNARCNKQTCVFIDGFRGSIKLSVYPGVDYVYEVPESGS